MKKKHIVYTKEIIEPYNTFRAPLKLWKVNTPLNVLANKVVLVYKGQGLGETKWKGCAWNLALVIFVIY